MLPRKGYPGKTTGYGNEETSSNKWKSVVSGSTMSQLGRGVADIKLGGGNNTWEADEHRTHTNSTEAWSSQSSNVKAWGHPDVIKKLGMRKNSATNAWTPQNRSNAWVSQTSDSQGSVGTGSPTSSVHNTPRLSNDGSSHEKTEPCNENESDELDDDCLSDSTDSDADQMTHEQQKSVKMFKQFFVDLDRLNVEDLVDPTRQWHCPACHGGPGAIDWYTGLQPLMSHAKTKGSKRVPLHRRFAGVLEEELSNRGATLIPAGEAFGKWKGLYEATAKDREIVWPPMVIIMNTKLEQDDNDKWIGMGNQELLEYFSSYAALRARHAYGPQGHRGMSVLIFEASAMGYLEAERLHKHFQQQGTDKNAWDHHPIYFYPGGKRQLYGYMAAKEDMESFNHHSHGKSKMKYEMRSYHEMVVNQIRQMGEDNQQLILYKERVSKEQRRTKALEESFGRVTEKLRKTIEENRIVRQRTKLQHQENQEEMEYQEEFFKDQMKIIHEAREAREDEFEHMQQEERQNVKENTRGSEEVEKFIKFQENEMEEYVCGREDIIKVNEEKKRALRQKYIGDVLLLEKELDSQLAQLMANYTLHAEHKIA